jgi:hypothetical protein
MLTVAEVRELLGPLAEGKSDAEIVEIRDRFADMAYAILETADGHARRADAEVAR